jgi:hypothetical protein
VPQRSHQKSCRRTDKGEFEIMGRWSRFNNNLIKERSNCKLLNGLWLLWLGPDSTVLAELGVTERPEASRSEILIQKELQALERREGMAARRDQARAALVMMIDDDDDGRTEWVEAGSDGSSRNKLPPLGSSSPLDRTRKRVSAPASLNSAPPRAMNAMNC